MMIFWGHKVNVLGLDCALRLCWSHHEPELPEQGVSYRGERRYEAEAFLSLFEKNQREDMRLSQRICRVDLF